MCRMTRIWLYTQVCRIHSLGTMTVCTRSHSNPSNRVLRCICPKWWTARPNGIQTDITIHSTVMVRNMIVKLKKKWVWEQVDWYLHLHKICTWYLIEAPNIARPEMSSVFSVSSVSTQEKMEASKSDVYMEWLAWRHWAMLELQCNCQPYTLSNHLREVR